MKTQHNQKETINKYQKKKKEDPAQPKKKERKIKNFQFYRILGVVGKVREGSLMVIVTGIR